MKYKQTVFESNISALKQTETGSVVAMAKHFFIESRTVCMEYFGMYLVYPSYYFYLKINEKTLVKQGSIGMSETSVQPRPRGFSLTASHNILK